MNGLDMQQRRLGKGKGRSKNGRKNVLVSVAGALLVVDPVSVAAVREAMEVVTEIEHGQDKVRLAVD